MMKTRRDLAIENADGELIILDRAAGKVHQLNSSASFVWNCLSDGLENDEIARKISEAFDVEHDSAISDVDTVLAQLRGLGLVVD